MKANQFANPYNAPEDHGIRYLGRMWAIASKVSEDFA